MTISLFSFGQDTACNLSICHYPDEMPEYPGGEKAMMKFIQTHLEYPIHMDTQGRVVVGFVVNKNGSLSDIKIKRGLCKQADAEVIRVIKLLPKFKPSMQQGKPMATQMVIPIMFKQALSELPDKK